MQVALIAMTILGCDDAVTQCHYVATVPKRYASVEMCDAASQRELSRLRNVHYPSVVAVCEKDEKAAAQVASASPVQQIPAAQPAAAPAPPQPVPPSEADAGMLSQTMALLSDAGGEAVSMGGAMVRWPTHVVSKSYSWLVRKVTE